MNPRLSKDFTWLWRAYAVSTLGSYLALDAFALIAIRVLHSGAGQVSLLAAAAGAVAALLAVPLGPWIEFRPKRRLMMRADLLRFGVLMTVPAADAAGMLTYLQLLVVAVVVAVADIAFTGASGAHLKSLVDPPQLLEAGSRFEAATWVSSAVGPPIGGFLIGAVGPVITVVLNAVSFLLSACGLRAIAAPEPPPPPRTADRTRLPDVTAGWRTILADRDLRLLVASSVLGGGLIMATAPPLAFLMLHDLGFAPWQYGLVLGGIPCLGGVVGSRLSRPLAARYGDRRIMLVFCAARAFWLPGLALVGRGVPGLLVVLVVELGMITCIGISNPLLSTYRLQRPPAHQTARVMTAYAITSKTSIAVLTAVWGVLAAVTSARTAIAIGGLLMLATPLLLPWRASAPPSRPGGVPSTVDRVSLSPNSHGVFHSDRGKT